MVLNVLSQQRIKKIHKFLHTHTVCPYCVESNYKICQFDNRKNRLTCIDYILAKDKGIQRQKDFVTPYTQDVMPTDQRWSLLEDVKHPVIIHQLLLAWISLSKRQQLQTIIVI